MISSLAILNVVFDSFSSGAMDMDARRNLQTIMSGAPPYWPTIFALVQDNPQDNIARTIRMFRVRCLRGSIN